MKTSPPRTHIGITLLEMLAVATILAIIAAVVVPRFANSTNASEASVVTAHHVARLNALVEQHYLDTSSWPSDLKELVTDGYLDAVPAHPDSSRTYSLNTTSNKVEEVTAP